MHRFVDYVVLVGYDFDKFVEGEGGGRILERFPTKCWRDYPYNFEIETFCQPCGWFLSRGKSPPTFFVAYLTDLDGKPYFAACLTFHEAVSSSQLFYYKMQHLARQKKAKSAASAFNHNHFNGSYNGSFIVNKNKSSLPISNHNSQFVYYPVHSRNSITSLDSNSSSPISSTFDVHDQLINHSEPKSIYDASDPNLVHPPELYAPKCLVFLARHQHFDVLKNSLSLLYTVFADSLRQYSVEQMIATVLGGVEVPPTGGPRVTFSLGTGDRQIIQPAHCSTIPVTRNCVAVLFKHLGVHNVILLFTAIISDQKVLLCSRSLNRLTEACHALTSILYPLKYGHTYVPILPKSLIEFVNAPTPFLYGIHSSYQHLLPDTVDVFVADLDGGSVVCPENTPVPQLPDPYFTEVVENLFQILSPELMTADHIYPPATSNQPIDLVSQDKKLRAVFLRLFASLFAGYRSCLTITRIHPQPVIHFNQTLYLLLRGNTAHNEFYDRLLSSMRFHQFILERGPPFRVCDLFDEEYDVNVDDYSLFNTGLMNDKDYDYEMRNHSELNGGVTAPANLHLIERLSTKLLSNECGDQPVTQILPNEAVEAHKRIHQTPFPTLDAKLIDELIIQYSQKKAKNVTYHKPEPRFVPQGKQLDRQIFKAEMFPDKYRVIHEFVDDIFNQHITEALKRRNTIRQDLKSRPMRRLFVDELRRYLIPDTISLSPTDAINDFIGNMTVDRSVYEKRAVLTWEQFELIVDLLDEALRQETQSKDSGITPIIMDLSTRLCTELENVRYYANMSHQIQRHDIWRHMAFWESVFNEQVNNQIRLLYIDFSEEELKKSHKQQQQSKQHFVNLPNGHTSSSPSSLTTPGNRQCKSPSSPEKDGVSIVIVGRSDNQKSTCTIQQQCYTPNMSALEIAAEEMRIGHTRSQEVQQALETREESTIYAQIIHFINLIVNFRIPVHIGAAVADLYCEESLNNDLSGDSNRRASDNDYKRQQTPDTITSNDMPVTSQINHTLRLISQSSEASGKNNSRYYPNSSLAREGFYSFYNGHNVNEFDSSTLLNHITVLENWLLKFVKNVGEENNLQRKRITEIEGKIKAIIESHLINLQAIYPKVQNIPHMKKPEIANPVLLPGEIAIPIGGYDCLSCQLLPDGRYERSDYQPLDSFPIISNTNSNTNVTGNDTNGYNDKQDSFGNNESNDMEVDVMLRPLLPAQGALFVTNYRIIFTGVPKDPFQSNKVINRSFPISALSNIKKLGYIQLITTFPSSSSTINPGALTTMTSISGFRSATLFAGKKSKSYTMYGKNISSKYLSPSSSSRSTYTTTTTNRNGVVYRTENLDVILLRALTFQMLKIGFDVGEIQQETRDELRNLLEELRYPSMLCMGFNSAPLGLVLSRTNSMMDNINILSSIHSNFPNNSVGNTKEYISSGMMRMRHLKGKTNRNVTLNDSNYSALMNRDRRRTYGNQQSISLDNKSVSSQLTPWSPRSNRCNQINYITSSPFPNTMYIEEAAANLASAIKSFLSPPTLSASSSAATVIDPNLIRLITDSSGYLDMARFGINVSGNTANTMVTIAAATSQINYSRVINDCTGSLNRSTYGAGSSVGSRMYCAAHLVAFNVHHTLVKSYPSLFIVPQGISQNCLIKVARSHKRGRFPVVTWQHPETGAYLLRGSEIQSNVILNTFKNIKTSSKSNAGDYVDDGVDSSFSHATASKEHIRYIRALVDMSLSAINSSRPSSVITSETGYSAADDLSNSSQLPTNPIKTADSVTISSPDYVSRERRQIPDKISPTISHVNNNKTRLRRRRRRRYRVREALGRIGMFAARRRLAHSGLSPMGSIASGLDEDLISMDSASQNSNPPNNSRQSIYDTNSVGVPGPIPSGISYSNRPISLYILCEKQMTKMSKIFNSSSVLLSPIDYPSVSSVNKCFKGFFKACLPNDSNRSKTSTKILSAAANTAGIPLDHTSGGGNATNMHSNSGTMAASHFNHNHSQSNNTNSGIVNGEQTETENITTSLTTNTTTAKLLNVFIEAHENGWFTQLKSLLELAGTVVDLLDLQGASVALCLENGSDVVAQTVSLVQVMLDPYYRTIAGFWSLIDKEWLIFGHTFNQNLNQTLSTKSGSISPIFLQFLDAVHQLLRQFPLAFEFNDYYLRFLAYHHVSNRFHNFKYDSELEKFTAWFPDLVESLANNYKLGTSIVSNIDEHLLELYRSRSIWPFIQQQHYEWPVFFNFRYSRTLGEKVLRPATNLASLDLWQFYLTEDLAFGPIYDLDHFSPSYRKHTNRPYEPVLRQGFNNSHIEQTYAVLGLREGEEAIGWQEAWEQAQSEILNPYSQLSPTHKRVNRPHDKPYINNIQPITNSTGTISTATVTANIVSSINTTTTVTSDTNNKTNHAKAVNKFVPLLSRFTTYRESSEPTESVLHRKLIESEYSLARRRAISSNVLDANQTKKSLQSSGTSSSGYPPKHPGVVVDDDDDDDVTQTTTLTPQGGTVSDAIDLDGDLLWYSENNTINSMPVTTSELNLNDTPQPRVIIVKDSSVERDDQSQLNGDMSTTSTTSTTITVKAIKDFSNLHFKKNGNESKQQITGTGADSGGGGVYNTNHQQIPACEPISEDEAFHEDNEDIYGDRYNSIEESSIDDYNFTRHAILEYHRTATLKRLTRRTGSGASSNVVAGGGGVCNTVPNSQSHPIHDRTLDNGLTPGGHQSITIEYESGSITSIGCDPGGASITPVKSAGLPLQNELQMHKFTSSQADTNISCELCHQKCQSTDNLVKCIECDLLCHEKCSTLDSKCLPTSIINTCNQTKKLGNILKRHDSAYLPSETDNRKSNQLDERGRSTPAFGGGSGGGGSGLFSPTLPWRVERDQSIRSSMILIQDNRGGKRKLSESSSSPGQINTLPDTTQSQGARSLSGAELPKHLASSSYYGYLYKLSHRKFLQQWKQRLFALDTNRHQLKYYESYAESLPRGCIDLQDVRNVKIMKNFTYQRKSLAIVVFELETNNRTYRLGAANQESAMQWIERIQKAIQ